ncbi:vitellogenin receptor-like [Xenentodon cancila]
MDLRLCICLVFLAILRIYRGQILGCPKGQWQCDDGSCITDAWRCDGQGDCLDGSDEMDCAETSGSDCPAGQFPCVDSVGCVDASARCDGQIQCPTGSDEENCPATEGCLDSELMCQNNLCVPEELRCNRQNDCMDNSDEDDCGLCIDGLRCPEGTCISAEERCDGQVHCSDGRDEPMTCGRICSMNNGGCSHVCTDEPWGARCTCPVGYKLSPNGAVCEDLDECASSFAPCAHHCTNTIGSYFCHCREGFKLNGSSSCVASGNATRLLILTRSAVGLLTVKSQQFDGIKTSVFEPVALAYDIARGWQYWADGSGNIFKSNGRFIWKAYGGPPGIKGLACDWLNGFLFWTNQKTKSIYMQTANGKSYTTLLNKNVSPSDLVLLPTESMMFWINDGPGERVTMERSWMDGSDRSSLVVLTAQSAHSLTADVAASRLYWISDFKRSVETVKVDGTGRYSFLGLFNRRPALSLAVFESTFYWFDGRGLWQLPQNQPTQRKFIWKAEISLMVVYHELQQPKGSSACVKTQCTICQLTKNNRAGFICACPSAKVLLPDGTCEYPRFIYATTATISLLEFRGREWIETQLFVTDDGILSFDLDWYRDWLYWATESGRIKRTSLTQTKTEVVPTTLPVCLITVDQMSGNLYWVSCDQNTIGTTTTDENYPKHLYHTTRQVRGLYLDWVRGVMFWLEEDRIFSMDLLGGEANELLEIAGGVRGDVAFDIRAASLFWNSKRAGLTSLSLLQEQVHQAGRRWNISGSVVAAFEPYLLSISDNVMILWDRRDGSPVQDVTVRGRVLSVIAALGKIETVPDTPVCNEPSLLCRHSLVCLPQARLCDGKRDCPEGDDEESCVVTCPPKAEFRCKDRRSCVSKSQVCDGRAQCFDGSDEVDCPSAAPPASPTDVLKCRFGSSLCRDGKSCVLLSHICDGDTDCPDGSDEEDCDDAEGAPSISMKDENMRKSTPVEVFTPPPTEPPCTSPSVQCPGSSLCIKPTQMCDGKRDCPDGSDEKCVRRCSSNTDFLCKDRRSCVSKSQVCDGRAQCFDGSDEVDCPSAAPPAAPTDVLKCRFGSSLCGDGKSCVLLSHICDGDTDCPDGSDEEDCDVAEGVPSISMKDENMKKSRPVEVFTPPPTEPPCTSPSVQCPGSSLCIKPTQMCDGKRDCPDGSDEQCVRRCPSRSDFRCKDRRSCVSKSQVCDGRAQCFDGSDEVDCPSAAPPAAPTDVLKCRFGSSLCGDGKSCVLLSHICDGDTDCPDGSDEEDCGEYLSKCHIYRGNLNISI